MFVCYQYLSQRETIYDKILPTIISVSVAILLFIIARYIERRNNKKEFERNWYYKVIIEPNISKIGQFIDNLFVEIKNSLTSLISASKDLSYKEYLIKKTKEFDKIKKVIQNFEMDFIILLKNHYPSTEKLLSNLMFDIQDDILNILDDENLEEKDYAEIEKKIKEYKTKVLIILHKQVE